MIDECVTLEWEEAALKAVKTDSNLVVIAIDSSFVIRWASPSCSRYDLDPTGQSITDLIHPDDLELAEALAGTLDAYDAGLGRAQMRNTVLPLRVITPTGVVEVEGTGSWHPVGEDRCLVVTLRDVSVLRRADHALEALAGGAGQTEVLSRIRSAVEASVGVSHCDIVWMDPSGEPTSLTSDDAPRARRLYDLAAASEDVVPGIGDGPDDAEWSVLWPVRDETETLGAVLVWGVGQTPSLLFAAHALSRIFDITALALLRSRAHAELEQRATTDHLTGLMNRQALLAHLDGEAADALLYVDLDGFKAVNDTYGHATGDQVLVQAAERFRDVVRDDDLVARLGGDEFTILCHRVDPTVAADIGSRVVAAFERPFVVSGRRVAIGASVGLAMRIGQESPELLLARADRALYEAKATGRGRVCEAS